MADNKQISLLLRNLTLDFSVTHITNKPDISAFQTTSVNWYRTNVVSRNETKIHFAPVFPIRSGSTDHNHICTVPVNTYHYLQ
jgi:hypothetical protein